MVFLRTCQSAFSSLQGCHAVVGVYLHIVNRRFAAICHRRVSNHLMLFMKHGAGGEGMSLALNQLKHDRVPRHIYLVVDGGGYGTV